MNLKEILNTPAKIKIISFFEENPASIDTAKGIATWINCEVKEAEKALKDLVKDGLLVAHSGISTIAYAYTQNKKLAVQIRQFLHQDES